MDSTLCTQKKIGPLSLILHVILLVGLCGCPDKNDDPRREEGEIYPRTTFDLDEFEATLNAFGENYGAAGLGTLTRPQIPALPQEPFSEVVAVDAQIATDFAAQGHMQIAITNDINGTVFLGRASDVTIRLNGFRIDQISLHQFGFQTSAATRVLIVGPGIIGAINAPQAANGYPLPTDILIDGVWIGPDFQSSPSEGGINIRGQRIGVVNCIIRGFSEPVSGVAGALMGGDDIFFFNTNIGAGLNATGNLDDWGYRMSDNSNRHVLANCMIRSKNKPCVRQGGSGIVGRVLYSTPDVINSNRKMTLYNSYTGNMDASIPQISNGVNTIHTDLIVSMFVRWLAANESQGNVTLWGPGPFTDELYLYRDIEVVCQDGLLSRIGKSAREEREQFAETNEIWDFYAGQNSESGFANLPEVIWPEVISPLVGNIGSNPYDDPK